MKRWCTRKPKSPANKEERGRERDREREMERGSGGEGGREERDS